LGITLPSWRRKGVLYGVKGDGARLFDVATIHRKKRIGPWLTLLRTIHETGENRKSAEGRQKDVRGNPKTGESQGRKTKEEEAKKAD